VIVEMKMWWFCECESYMYAKNGKINKLTKHYNGWFLWFGVKLYDGLNMEILWMFMW